MSVGYRAGSVDDPRKTTQLPSQAGEEMGTARPRSPSAAVCGGAAPVPNPGAEVGAEPDPGLVPEPGSLVAVGGAPAVAGAGPAGCPAAVGSAPLRHSTIATAVSRIAVSVATSDQVGGEDDEPWRRGARSPGSGAGGNGGPGAGAGRGATGSR